MSSLKYLWSRLTLRCGSIDPRKSVTGKSRLTPYKWYLILRMRGFPLFLEGQGTHLERADPDPPRESPCLFKGSPINGVCGLEISPAGTFMPVIASTTVDHFQNLSWNFTTHQSVRRKQPGRLVLAELPLPRFE
ncbi:uncharacterized protein LOC119397282 isoform X2 [Rhipicephalus sanguineus]|uniref:uncharacterized protein LOC119397282 isoform X2 n=1 Tax=Rhipicephalus sanguineus TaxID=34632 RepID=UPI0020C5214D|nr:uncharacterized protein LOC119397282 isoform X2 [Rhipicephalus sanguineus]